MVAFCLMCMLCVIVVAGYAIESKLLEISKALNRIADALEVEESSDGK